MKPFECPKCRSIQFDLEEIQTDDRSVVLCMVRCHTCGREAGIFDKTTSDLLYDLKNALDGNGVFD
jgi:predicted nucleic-acid-binding Zn-ribbon protein